MIQLKVVKQKDNSIRNQFVVEADEPVTIEFLETEDNHTIAHIYRGTETDEYSEPVGAYDSAVDNENWKVD